MKKEDSRKKAIIFDMVGVLFSVNTFRIIRHLGIIDLIRFYLRYRMSPFDFCMELLDKMRLEAPGEFQKVFTLQGTYLPLVIGQWQRGHVTTNQAFSKVWNFVISQKETKKKDKILLHKLFSLIFDSSIGLEILKPVKPAMDVIRELHKKNKHKLYILSNIDTETLASFKSLYQPFFDLFDGIVTSCQTQKLKPFPEIYAHLLQEYNLDPNDCYFIDDQKENLKAAKHLGINTIECTKQTDLREELRKRNLL